MEDAEGVELTVDRDEVIDRLIDSYNEETVCLLHPQEAEVVWDYIEELEKKDSRSEWVWIFAYIVCFWAAMFWWSGWSLMPPLE